MPVLFVIENNGYGLSTPNKEQFKGESLSIRGEGENNFMPTSRIEEKLSSLLKY